RALQTQIGAQRERLQTLAIDPEQLKQLQATHNDLQTVQARQQAVATRVGWDLQPGQSLDIAGATVGGQDQTLLLEDTRIDIPGVGTLSIQPGGSDIAELRRERGRLTSDRNTLLWQLGADSL